jgi:hypothetical protein
MDPYPTAGASEKKPRAPVETHSLWIPISAAGTRNAAAASTITIQYHKSSNDFK